MGVDWNIVAMIAAPIIALFVGAALTRVIESRASLVAYLAHASVHQVTQDNGTPYRLFTHAVVVRNAGRKPATNVRVSHAYLPNYYIYPDVEHEVVELQGGGKEIVFPAIVPKEQVTISYLYLPPITWNQVNGIIKSNEGLARTVQVLPTQQYPKWVTRVLLGLVVAGVVAIAYVVFVTLRALT